MKKRENGPRKNVEVFFKEGIQTGEYEDYDVLQEALCEIAGINYEAFSEFGSGCSASDCFPAEEADRIAKALRSKIRRKVAGLTISSVEVTDVHTQKKTQNKNNTNVTSEVNLKFLIAHDGSIPDTMPELLLWLASHKWVMDIKKCSVKKAKREIV